MIKNSIKPFSLTLLTSTLFLLPGCDLFTSKKAESSTAASAEQSASMPAADDGSMVLVSIDSKPLITRKSLDKEKTELLESNPQLKAMIAYMDDKQLDRNLAEGLLSQALVDQFIVREGIDKDPQYQQELKRAEKSVKQVLNAKYFTQRFPVTISDAEVEDFYNKNKDVMPQLLISQGGVKASGVSFTKEQDAKDFLAKVKTNKGDLQKTAQAANLSSSFVDWKVINGQTAGIDARLREKIMNLKAPTIEMIKVDDKTFWVVNATSKEEKKYRPLDQIKDDLRQFLEKEKRVELFDQEIAKLKEQYKVKLNEEFFKEQPGEAEGMMEQPAAVPAN